MNLSVGFTTSVAEEIAKAAPDAKIVKAFNTLGVGNIANLVFDGQTASGFMLFRFADGQGPNMKVLELIPNQRVAWECLSGAPEWVGTQLTFELKEDSA